MPYIEIKLGPDTLLLRFVGRIDYVFGRLPRADVQLRDMKVSRLHTQVFIDSRGGAFIRDLGSSGGTYIGNQRLRKGVVAPLTNGLKFRIGDSALTFYDAEPPVNAIDPPGRSEPRGLIRTNHRDRQFEGEVTVLAADRVTADTASGPAEAPPEINPADFADRPDDLAPKPAAQRPATKRNTGIVEAPWDKRDSGPVGPTVEKRVTIPPQSRGAAPPQMPTAEVDELGNYRHQPAPQPPVPPEELDETGRTSREPVVHPSAPVPADELVEVGESEDVEEVPQFQPPPPIAGALPLDDEEDAPPRMGMPTVRLERPALLERQRQIEEEEAAEAAALRIPTAKVEPGALIEDEAEPPPRIGEPAVPAESSAADGDESEDAEEDLTDDQIAEYLGGSLSGRFGNVDFGDADGSDSAAEDAAEDEISFGVAAQATVEGDDEQVDIDIEDEPEPEPVHEARTSMTGDVTAVKEEPVEEVAEEVAEVAAEESAAEPEAEPPATNEPPESAAPPDDDDIPTFPDEETPPPPSREGATPERTFKPRKTRKLMKRRKDTAKITDKSNPTPPPAGSQTEALPLPASLRQGDQPVAPGAKTMFVPKPERPTGKPQRHEENREPASLDDMAHGPGGDTLAMPPNMMAQLKEELDKQAVKRPAPRTANREEPPSIGESPTVRSAGLDDDEEDDFILDDEYAFFTPPPPTRKARDAAREDDVIDANDFNAEIDNLPANKKKPKDDPETLVE